MTPGAGAAHVRLSTRDGRVSVDLRAPAPAPFARLVRGRRPEDAARIAAILFGICAAAQEAATRAAFGLPPAPDMAAKLREETLRDHALKLFVTVPRALGQPEDPMGPALLRAGGAGALVALFGARGEAPRSLDALHDWAARGETAPARAMAALLAWPEDWAAAAPAFLCIARAPDWSAAGQGGKAAENSTLLRTLEMPLMQELLIARGPGPALRLLSLTLEAGRLATCAAAPWPMLRTGTQVAVQAARGALMMRGTLDAQGLVADVDRLSPTEFVLAPRGTLTRVLEAAPCGPGAPTETVARVALALVDPCTPVRLEVEHA